MKSTKPYSAMSEFQRLNSESTVPVNSEDAARPLLVQQPQDTLGEGLKNTQATAVIAKPVDVNATTATKSATGTDTTASKPEQKMKPYLLSELRESSAPWSKEDIKTGLLTAGSLLFAFATGGFSLLGLIGVGYKIFTRNENYRNTPFMAYNPDKLVGYLNTESENKPVVNGELRAHFEAACNKKDYPEMRVLFAKICEGARLDPDMNQFLHNSKDSVQTGKPHTPVEAVSVPNPPAQKNMSTEQGVKEQDINFNAWAALEEKGRGNAGSRDDLTE